MIYFLVAVLVVLVGIVIYLFIRIKKTELVRNIAEAKFQQLEGKINSLQLETLESKLNPHLFKNILNSVQSHAYQTYYALDKLSNVLDYILYDSRNKYVSPKE